MARPAAWTFLVCFVELRVVGRAAVNIVAQTDRGGAREAGARAATPLPKALFRSTLERILRVADLPAVAPIPWAAQRGSARFKQSTLWDVGGLAGGLDVDEVPGVLSAYRDA